MSTCPPRYGTRRSEERFTYGPKVADIAEALSLPLMPWQRYVADVALEVNPRTNHLAYRTVIITVPRQSGKTTLILPVMVHRALAFDGAQRLLYTAQSLKDARKKWRDDHVERLLSSPMADLFRVRKSHGDEAIEWVNGSKHMLAATTKKAAHGETLDFGAIDEAFALTDDRVEAAMRPAMITRPDAQLWIFSTQGDEESTFLNEKVELGRSRVESGSTEGVAYFEWSAPEGSKLDDPDSWSFHPAIGHTQSAETLMAEALTMPPDEAERAFFNWQVTSHQATERVVPLAIWQSRTDHRSSIDGRLVLGLDVRPDRGAASVGAAGRRPDGAFHVELVEHRAGTGWVARRVADLFERHDVAGVVLDPAGPAGSLFAELVESGVPEDLIEKQTAQGHAAACGLFYDLASGRDVRGLYHLAQPDLDDALHDARKRKLGNAGSWLWDRGEDKVDITPLVAVTLALGSAVGLPAAEETFAPFVII